MSACTEALVSLRKILVTVLYLQPRPHLHYRSQLESLLEEVDNLLLNFEGISSTDKASPVADELEIKVRDAAHRAEHVINLHGVPMMSPDDILFLNILFISLSPFLVRLGAVASGLTPFILVEAAICIVNAGLLHLWVREKYGFPTRNASREWRRLFADFRIIVEEVNRNEESSSSLISLRRILGSLILDDSGYNAQLLKSLHEKVTFLLENASSCSLTQNLDAKMRDAVFKAKRALIEFQLPRNSDLIFDWRRFCTFLDISLLILPVWLFILFRLIYYMGTFPYYSRITPPEITWLEIIGQSYITFATYMCSVVIALMLLPVRYNYEAPENQELAHVVEDFDIILRDMNKDGCGEGGDLATAASSRQDLGGSCGKDVVVGLERDVDEIKDRLLQVRKKLELISIVGMRGIGKTTLANKVYYDPYIVEWFDVCAWTTVSTGITLRHVLLSLLDSARMLTEVDKRQDSDQELGVHLHKYLTGRRYLIVVDDLWDIEIWDFLRRHFPENYDDSRVLLTSRLSNVVSGLDSISPLHHMKCLDEDHSWDLLCREVFGGESCPWELEYIVRKIAQRCGGLPLAIVVIGGLLYKDIQLDVWRDVAEKLEKSEVQDIKERCLEILGLSYNHLPRHLKPCFLYMGLFLAHREIPISTLVNLWIAEGFLRPCGSKTMEEQAEGYVEVLIDRNLISVSKRSCNGKIRRCSMHDLLRDVCVENAREANFRQVVESGGYVISREGPDEPPHGLSIDPNVTRVDDIHDYLDSEHLRVVNVLGAKFGEFPRRITQLVSLRYLAFQYDGSVRIPPSIFKLQYLETLVLHHSSFGKNSFLPSSIWRMPNLRHIDGKPGCYMFKHLGLQLASKYSLLINLQTLVGIRNFKWSQGIWEEIPNLKKLGISYDFSSTANWSTYQLENLVSLKKLESLKISVKYDDLGSAVFHDPPKLEFPQKLKKLSLSGCRIPWESMSAIGALPDLEALKLKCKAFSGLSWKTAEDEFPQLVFLLLEEMSFTTWESEESHFPRLQRLVLRSCVMLVEIPFIFGEIPTLESIQLIDCHPLAVASAKEIQNEQRSVGNEALKFQFEQRRRAVDGTDSGKSGARGTVPGVFEVFKDALDSTPLEMLLSFYITACFIASLLAFALLYLFKFLSFSSSYCSFSLFKR